MCKVTSTIALVLLIIGGLNWGLVGLADKDLVAMLFGTGVLAQIVYVLVGLSAIYSLTFFKHLGLCGGECESNACCMGDKKDDKKEK